MKIEERREVFEKQTGSDNSEFKKKMDDLVRLILQDTSCATRTK